MRFRPPVVDDAEAVLAVLVARDIADVGAPDYTLADLRQEWSASEFDLSSDAVLVEDPAGQVLAYAVVRRPGTLAAVAPEHEGKGIGTQLLSWAEGHERELGRVRHRQWIAATNEGAKELLCRAGYGYARSYWRMLRELDQRPGEPVLPAGIRIRALDVARDAAELHALDAASFGRNPDYQPVSLQAFTEEHLGSHDVDPELCLVAEGAGTIAGFLLALRWEQESVGFVDILAVHPDRQRGGVGSALLQSAFARIAAAGLREAQLNVASDNPSAVALYERVGMKVKFRFDTYERAVAPLVPPDG